MMFAHGIETAAIYNHIVIYNAVRTVVECRNMRFLSRIVALEHFLEHPQHPIRRILQTFPIRVIPDIFQKFPDMFFCRISRNHISKYT